MKLTLSDFFKLLVFLHVWSVKSALNKLANQNRFKPQTGVYDVLIFSVSCKLSALAAPGRSAAKLLLLVI